MESASRARPGADRGDAEGREPVRARAAPSGTRGRRPPRPALALLALLGGCLVAAATRAAPTVVVDDRGTRVSVEAPPRRIVSLLPSLTETVCALGACERLVGVDRFSDWPESVAALPDLGGLEDPQVERLYALRPDLVLAAESGRGTARLESLGLTVVALEARSLADVRRVVTLLGELLGRPAAAAALLTRLEEDIAEAATAVPAGWRGARVYFEVSEAPYAAGAASFIGELLSALGLHNIVPPSLGPFPKLAPEFVVRENPDLILGAERDVASMDGRPGWDAIDALERGHVCAFEARRLDVLVRPGPRLGEAARAIVDCLTDLPPRGR